MRAAPAGPLGEESGFSLIELLVVILIIGILAAIAIPSFLSQKSKATDASAKELARTAQTTAESYGTDHEGMYKGLSAAELKKYEPTIVACTKKASELNDACLKKMELVEAEKGYVIETESLNGAWYKVTRSASGQWTRSCGPTSSQGCPTGSW